MASEVMAIMDDPIQPHGSDPGGLHPLIQNFQHTPGGARLPEKVGRGVFSSAIMLLQTHDLFVVDFLSMMVPPQQVVARIVTTASSFMQFLAALRTNLGNYEGQIGPLALRSPAAPAGPHAAGSSVATAPPGVESAVATPEVRKDAPAEPAQPTITELYDQVKFPEELLPGVFANAVMIRHTPEEFCFDFIANLFPRPVVVSRVYMAAGRVPSLLEAMSSAAERYQQHGPGSPPPPPLPP
jgi:hypothetical protein